MRAVGVAYQDGDLRNFVHDDRGSWSAIGQLPAPRACPLPRTPSMRDRRVSAARSIGSRPETRTRWCFETGETLRNIPITPLRPCAGRLRGSGLCGAPLASTEASCGTSMASPRLQWLGQKGYGAPTGHNNLLNLFKHPSKSRSRSPGWHVVVRSPVMSARRDCQQPGPPPVDDRPDLWVGKGTSSGADIRQLTPWTRTDRTSRTRIPTVRSPGSRRSTPSPRR